MKKSLLVLGCFIALGASIVRAAEFDFYGVKFGMDRSEVAKVFKIKSQYGINEVESPGYYMKQLFLRFDQRNRLFHIEAYYLNEKNETGEAWLMALKERFESSIGQLHADIDVKIDTYRDVSRYGTADCFVVQITSQTLRKEYVTYLKNGILNKIR